MADAVQVRKLTIKCDSCDFRVEGSPEDWHKKACPECGAQDIVDDKDMKIFRGMMGLVGLMNGLAGDVKGGHSATVSVDTADLNYECFSYRLSLRIADSRSTKGLSGDARAFCFLAKRYSWKHF